MAAEKKEITLERNDEVMTRLLELEKKAPPSVSLTRFIDMNFSVFADSGRTTREIYEFLKDENIDVSSFKVFKTLYSKVKKSRERANSALITSAPMKSVPVTSVPIKLQTPRGALSMPPVILPGGVEAMIDPETGAKNFEIKSGRRG
jgi:hypothetical protein